MGNFAKFVLVVVIYCFRFSTAIPNAKVFRASELKIGTKYAIRSVYGQDCYITVHDNGRVDTQYLAKNGDAISESQIWSIEPHPHVPGSFQLTQDKVQFNELSGYQNTEEGYDPPLFPRQLTFEQVSDGKWQIEIRVRWCLRFLGRGNQMDIDDCELEYEPEKLWDFIEV